MAFFAGIKTMMAIAIHLFAYIVWILSIVQVCKYKDMYGQSVDNYVPAIVAILVMSSLQTVYHLGYWVYSKRALYSIRNMMIAMFFFLCFNFGAVVALTVQRHDFCDGDLNGGTYKSGVPYTKFDCQGVIRAMMGMTWNLFGWDLLYVIFLFGLKSQTRSSSSTPVGKAGEQVITEDEKVVV